jgi:hypothetical protein
MESIEQMMMMQAIQASMASSEAEAAKRMAEANSGAETGAGGEITSGTNGPQPLASAGDASSSSRPLGVGAGPDDDQTSYQHADNACVMTRFAACAASGERFAFTAQERTKLLRAIETHAIFGFAPPPPLFQDKELLLHLLNTLRNPNAPTMSLERLSSVIPEPLRDDADVRDALIALSRSRSTSQNKGVGTGSTSAMKDGTGDRVSEFLQKTEVSAAELIARSKAQSRAAAAAPAAESKAPAAVDEGIAASTAPAVQTSDPDTAAAPSEADVPSAGQGVSPVVQDSDVDGGKAADAEVETVASLSESKVGTSLEGPDSSAQDPGNEIREFTGEK